MNVEIRPELLRQDGNDDSLTELLALFEGGRHRLCTHFFPEIENTPWYLDAGKPLRKRIINQFKRPMDRRGPLTVVLQAEARLVPHHQQRQGTLPIGLEAGLKLLRNPVTILLENGTGDTPFISFILEKLSIELLCQATDAELREKWLYDLQNPGPDGHLVAFRHGGGDQTAQEAQQWLNAKPPGRVLAIVDRDARYEGHGKREQACGETGKKVIKLKQDAFGTDPRFQIHVLYRREMENYLPQQMLELVADANIRARLEAYGSLTPLQRHFWDVKEGLSSSLKSADSLSAPEYWEWKSPAEKTWWMAEPRDTLRNSGSDLNALFYGLGGIAVKIWSQREKLKEADFSEVREEAKAIAEKLIQLL